MLEEHWENNRSDDFINQEWLNKTDHNGHTAIKWATIHGHSHVVRILADAGADLNVQDNTLDTGIYR